MKTVEPLADKIIAKRIFRIEEERVGSIIVPDQAKSVSFEALILAVGPGHPQPDGSFRPLDVKRGDRVLYRQFTGIETRLEEKDCILLQESDILAVIDDSGEI